MGERLKALAAQSNSARGDARLTSVRAQSNHGIDLRSSSCREIPGQQRDHSQYRHHPNERKRISWSGLKKKGSNQARKHQRSDDSNPDSNQRESQRFADHIELHPRLRRTQSHAYPDFLSLPCNGIGDNSVDPERSQKESQARESSDQQHKKPSRRSRVVHQPLDWFEFGRWLPRVDLP